MTSLDPISQHWIDQGGQQDPGAKAWADLHDDGAVSHHLHGATRNDAVADDLDADVRQAVAETKARDTDREDWDEAKPHREWLSERYPDQKLEDYAKGMLDWHGRFQRDPYSAKEAWIRHWAAQPPFHHKPKPTASKTEAPEGMRERWRDDWQRDQDVINGYRAAVKDKADRDGYASTGELRQQIKQQTGLTLNQFLDKCRAIDVASLDDPVGIANRFAIFSGAPATEAHAAELQHQANAGARVARVQAGLDRVVASGKLPGLGTERVDEVVAAVLTDSRFERSGDHGVDLERAYGIALTQLATGGAPAAAPDNARLTEAEKAVAWGRDTLPKYAELEGMIGEILVSPAFQPFRTGDPSVDLASAHRAAERFAANGGLPRPRPMSEIYAEVRQEFLNAGAAHEKSEAVKRSKRASRSVSGSPSPGSSSGGQRRDDSIEDAARAAYRSVSATV